MGLFDTIASLQKLAESPELEQTAVGIGKAATAIPALLVEIHAVLEAMEDQGDTIIYHLSSVNDRLVEISLGLDASRDPIARPPFSVLDVEAMMAMEPLVEDPPLTPPDEGNTREEPDGRV